MSETQPTWKLVVLALGIWTSFMVYGWALEHVTQKEYIYEQDGVEVKERFEFETSIVIMTAFSNALLAFVVLKCSRERYITGGAPYTEWMFAAFAYFGSHMLNYVSLRYIIYPLQVLVKSCKAIPVMFGEVIFESHVKLTRAKVVSVLMLCLGLVVFTVGKEKKPKTEGSDEHLHFDTKTFIGLFVVFMALLCDGIYGPYQNKIKTRAELQGFKVTGYHNMFNMNIYQGSFALAWAILTGELPKVASFIGRHPDVIIKLVKIGIAMCFGQTFIFQMQSAFGALTVTKTTTVRKLTTMLFSVWYFGHSLQFWQWVGIAMVFMSEPLGKLAAGKAKASATNPHGQSSSSSAPLTSGAGGSGQDIEMRK